VITASSEEEAAGRSYRLPTEAEWEYACRAGTTTPFAFGDSPSSTQANFDGSKTAPVGSYEPNAWGLHDMHGNVWEWCADWYGKHYYSRSPRQDPQGPQEEGEGRVIRGGGWEENGSECRSAVRDKAEPVFRACHIGFRVVCVAPGAL
jgi:formylglycine-generating enzyme required for sulfatase activity